METQHRNRKLALVLMATALAMLAAAYAAVPLYRLFCQVTGYGGTPARAAATTEPPAAAGGPPVTVRFNADTARGLAWRFRPAQRSVTVRAGEQNLVYYIAENFGAEALVGTATFNVTPNKAAQYFVKVDCFCFTEQRLAPRESADLPVSFYVDPELHEDPQTRDVETITLSYTFFPAQRAENHLAK